MKVYFFRKILLIASVLLLIGAGMGAFALSKDDIAYPVAELGGCKTEETCKAFCEKPKNAEACLNFAEKYNLLSGDEIEKARNFMAIGKGPGGCTTEASCEAYCDDVSNINECLDFAEDNNLISPDELTEGRRVQAALAKGAKLPGGCKNKSQCDSYCNDPNNMEECILFAEAAGFMPPDELADAKKMLTAIRNGVKPPPCRSKAECDVYCQEPENFEKCLTFAEAAGFIPPEELEGAKKMLSALQKGVKPLPCRGREECDSYCSDSAHTEECIAFAEAAGFMSAEDAVMARKTGGAGPGGCKGQEACEQFCQNPDNQETCFNFAKEHGMMSEDDLQRAEAGLRERGEGLGRMQEALDQAPPEVLDCLRQNLGQDVLDKIRAGNASVISQNMGEAMRSCFESMMPRDHEGDGSFRGPEGSGGPPTGGFSGPGGCQTPEECEAYCQSHPEECGPLAGGFGSGGGESYGGGQTICPSMPTVDSCPEGQRKEMVFSSPGCGEYYTCVPEGGIPGAGPFPGGTGQYPQQYEQQYQQEYQQQYQQQYEQQYQQQSQPTEIQPSQTLPTEPAGANLLLAVRNIFNRLINLLK